MRCAAQLEKWKPSSFHLGQIEPAFYALLIHRMSRLARAPRVPFRGLCSSVANAFPTFLVVVRCWLHSKAHGFIEKAILLLASKIAYCLCV